VEFYKCNKTEIRLNFINIKTYIYFITIKALE